MGGTESIRGYIYQTIISVFTSLNNEDWDECKVEPKTESEKTDILLYKNGMVTSAIQVKSSTNLFTLPKINSWLKELIGDVRSAVEYDLILIGNADTKGNEFIKKINNGQIILPDCTASVHIELNVYNISTLTGAVENQLNIFLQKHGYHLKHDHISILTKTLLLALLEQSFVDKKLSRMDFAGLLISWAKSLIPKAMVHSDDNKIRLYAYNYGDRTELETITIARYDPHLDEKLHKLLFECRICFTRAKERPLPQRGSSKEEKEPPMFGVIIPNLVDVIPTEDQDIPKKVCTYIKECVSLLFDEQLSDEFFYVGDLKCQSLGFNKERVGTAAEKEKYYLIYKLYYHLNEVIQLTTYQESVKGYCPIPLIIKNEGNKFDEDIEIILEIPASIKILCNESLKVPSDVHVLAHILNSDFKDTLAMKGDVKINEYPDFSPMAYMPFTPMPQLFLGADTDYERQKLEREFDDLKLVHLDFELLGPVDGMQLIRYTFSKINPNVIFAFPGKLLLKTDMEKFDISYYIKSKHSADMTKRKITISQR